MPSPFPGVDPYLESQHYWEDFHGSFLPDCRDALNGILPDQYEARLGEHFHLIELTEPESKLVLPDVAFMEGDRKSSRGAARQTTTGGSLTLEPVTIPLPTLEMEVRDVWIEIRRRPDRTPVTVIEVLSPTNKIGHGLSKYRLKRRRLIHQHVHLIELDFLLSGHRLPMGRSLPPGDYYALVSRAENRPDCQVYAWTIRDPLPHIPIPLLTPDPDVQLDLGAVFATAYERGRYARSMDYTAPLPIVRNSEDRTWAERIAQTPRH
jgi:hypothetical protein